MECNGIVTLVMVEPDGTEFMRLEFTREEWVLLSYRASKEGLEAGEFLKQLALR
jgi:hypothetical protein